MSPSPVPSAPLAPGGADLLKAHGLPEHAPVEQLQALTRVAAALCGTPTAVVNLLDEDFQHQVGAVGFAGSSTDVTDSLCALGLRRPDLRHVPDAAREPAFAGNPWVDGRIADVRFYASAPIVLAGGAVIGSLCVFADEPGCLRPAQLDALADLARQAAVLIEQAQQARESAGQAALFRLVAEGSADVLSRHAPDGTVRYVSPSLRNVLGHEPVTGGRVADLLRIEPDDLPDVQDAARRVLAGGRSSAVLFRARHADRSVRWLEARLAPIRDEHGTVLELHSAARDVTERVRAAQELAQVAEQAAGLVETCADALVSVDEHDTVVDWTPQPQRRSAGHPGAGARAGADRGTRPGTGQHPGQDRVPRRGEPRDPHTAQRRAGHVGAARAGAADGPAGRVRGRGTSLRRGAVAAAQRRPGPVQGRDHRRRPGQ